jgi:thiamine pyridinylase
VVRHARAKCLLVLLVASIPWAASRGKESSQSFGPSSDSVSLSKTPEGTSTNPGSGGPRRKLRVVLYPIIPAFTDYMFQIKTGFEDSPDGRDIQIEFQDLTDGYYDPTQKNFIESAQADVYEIDSVFLSDFVSTGKIQQLPSQLVPNSGEFLANGQNAAQFQNKWYGVPHWVCGNLLFFKKGDSNLATVRTLSELQTAIGTTHQAGMGLFIDLKGKSTLGEFYLMSLFDRYQTFSQVQSHLTPYDSTIEDNLKRVGSLCDAGFCRNGNYHQAIGFYGSQFVRGRARAFVGYSESLYYMLWEAENACAVKEKCYTDADLSVAEVPLDDHGSKQMSWVDLLTIDKGCDGQCLSDATAFVSYVNSHVTQVRALTGYPPRYLLPARSSVYSDPSMQKAAPLYQQIRPIIEKAETPTAPKLDQTLRTYGATLDQNLPAPPAP